MVEVGTAAGMAEVGTAAGTTEKFISDGDRIYLFEPKGVLLLTTHNAPQSIRFNSRNPT